MKKRFFMPMILQFFAEPGDGGSGDGGDQQRQQSTNLEGQQSGEGDQGGKTFTRDEVGKMMAAEINKAKATWEKELEVKQAEADKLAKMNAQEKADHEKKQLQEKIAELERAQTVAAMAKEASSMFSEASLPHDDDLLELIVSDDADATKKAVAVITNYVSQIKKENARQTTPNEGGQFASGGNTQRSLADMAAKKRLVK